MADGKLNSNTALFRYRYGSLAWDTSFKMDQWSNPRQSYINQQENHYMMDTSAPINIMDMDASGPPRMVASDDIQIDCFNHDRIIERPMSPEVQKVRIFLLII